MRDKEKIKKNQINLLKNQGFIKDSIREIHASLYIHFFLFSLDRQNEGQNIYRIDAPR